MELNRKNIILTFTALSLSAAIVMGFRYIGEPMYRTVYKFIMSQEASGSRWLSWLFSSPWTDILVQYVFVLGLAYIPAYLLICWIPKGSQPSMKLSGEDFLVCTVAVLGLGYLMNLVGIVINTWLSMFNGKSLADMNPTLEMVSEFSPSMLLYGSVVAPVMEEWLFRGMLLKRARIFGDRTAVVFTALAFGMLHGNLAQFLYATGIGLIFGYVAVKTNRIRYTVLMHMIVNSFSTIVVSGEQIVYYAFGEFWSFFYAVGLLATIGFLILMGMVVLVRFGRHWYRQLTYHNGPPSDDKVFVYMNPGFVIYFGVCMMEFVKYLI